MDPIASKVESQPVDSNTATLIQPTSWHGVVGLAYGTQWNQGNDSGRFSVGHDRSQHFQLAVAGLRDLNRGDARFSLGPRVAFDRVAGGEGWKQLQGFSAGGRFQLDWTDLYSRGNGLDLTGPARFGLWLGLGYGWGVSDTSASLLLRNQSGLMATLGFDANLAAVHIEKASLSLELYGQIQSIRGSSFHNDGIGAGAMLSLRFPNSKGFTGGGCTLPPRPIDFAPILAENRQMRTKNEVGRNELGALRKKLESQESPLAVESIRDALFLREVGQALLKLGFAEKNVLPMVRSAYMAKRGGRTHSEVQAMLQGGIPGLSEANFRAATERASLAYPPGYDFWDGLSKDAPTVKMPDPIPEDAKAQADLFDALLEEQYSLKRIGDALAQKEILLQSVVNFIPISR